MLCFSETLECPKKKKKSLKQSYHQLALYQFCERVDFQWVKPLLALLSLLLWNHAKSFLDGCRQGLEEFGSLETARDYICNAKLLVIPLEVNVICLWSFSLRFFCGINSIILACQILMGDFPRCLYSEYHYLCLCYTQCQVCICLILNVFSQIALKF